MIINRVIYSFLTIIYLSTSCIIDPTGKLPVVYINPTQYNEQMCNKCVFVTLKSFNNNIDSVLPQNSYMTGRIGGICDKCLDGLISFDKESDGTNLNVNWKITSCNLRKDMF
jgi:hypothetical protein